MRLNEGDVGVALTGTAPRGSGKSASWPKRGNENPKLTCQEIRFILEFAKAA